VCVRATGMQAVAKATSSTTAFSEVSNESDDNLLFLNASSRDNQMWIKIRAAARPVATRDFSLHVGASPDGFGFRGFPRTQINKGKTGIKPKVDRRREVAYPG
jgi:hypothetical protein